MPPGQGRTSFTIASTMRSLAETASSNRARHAHAGSYPVRFSEPRRLPHRLHHGVCASAEPPVRSAEIANDDHLADVFLLPLHRIMNRVPRLTRRLFDRLMPGAVAYFNARTRHFDAIVSRQIDAGIDQLVVLGAGFDSRAMRFDARLGDVRVFEVDVADVIALKSRHLASTGAQGRAPDRARRACFRDVRHGRGSGPDALDDDPGRAGRGDPESVAGCARLLRLRSSRSGFSVCPGISCCSWSQDARRRVLALRTASSGHPPSARPSGPPTRRRPAFPATTGTASRRRKSLAFRRRNSNGSAGCSRTSIRRRQS